MAKEDAAAELETEMQMRFAGSISVLAQDAKRRAHGSAAAVNDFALDAYLDFASGVIGGLVGALIAVLILPI